jgi:hypothetical protein
MPSPRNYGYVPVTKLSPNGRRLGRKPKPQDEQLKHRVQVSLTPEQYEAFQRFMKRESLSLESVAGAKMVIDRLKADGLLKD